MARVVLDTGVLIAAVRAATADPIIKPDDDVAIPAVVVAEYLAGTLLDRDPARSAAQRAFMDELLEVLPIIEYSRDVAEHHAELLAHVRRSGGRRGAHDLIIAATARASGRILLSTDARANFGELPGIEVRIVGG